MLTRFLAVIPVVAGLMCAQVPRPAPDLVINRTGQPAVHLSSFRGKVVALACILTTCPHCQQVTQVLVEVDREYRDKGVQVLELAFNEDAAEKLPEFQGRFKPSFPLGYGDRAAVLTFFQRPVMDVSPFYVPQMAFVDRQGMIRAEYPGESPFFQNPGKFIRAELDKWLKAPPLAPRARKKQR